MSLGIAFKGAEGIVLAADSRVTLLAKLPKPPVPAGLPAGTPTPDVIAPATFDNATKLLHVPRFPRVAAVTYGLGAIGMTAPRTAASYLPEFDAELAKEKNLKVEDYAKHLGDFFMKQWTTASMPATGIDDMIFLVGGYDDEKAAYGRVFEIHVPSNTKPVELIPGQFGVTWGGQRELTDRLLQGFEPGLPLAVHEFLNTPPANRQKAVEDLSKHLRDKFALPVPWQFLPLQDCVHLAIFIIRTTITLQKWTVGVRGVGGAIDVAAITRTEGFKAIQQKSILGE